jgi:hypothetical protein
MDQQTPRELGDIEDAEPERREPGRSVPVKKSLDDFLAEFERRLRDSPGEPATSAPAALEGRAQGIWRTPVEASERGGRRPARRPPWRPDADRRRDAPAPPLPAPDPAAAVPEPVTVAGETEAAPDDSAVEATDVAEAITAPEPPAEPDAGATLEDENAEVATTGRKRHRRHRRHQRR